MALTISERWIRERVHLDPENLDDVRSLALPGTYHEKITHLGSALQNFLHLKHLDLSRNALQSLNGLQHLALLERLNIYYNNISTLKDLYQLRHNTSLQEVDLRLNPVTKNEPDYRLFMVHMLPNLRKLDDRSVRENERKAALMHFNTDQATELTEHPAANRPSGTDRGINPRAEMVANMARKTTVLDEDDCDVLDLIARSGGDLGKAREVTGSKAKSSKAATHSQKDQRGRDSPDVKRQSSPHAREPPSTKYPPSPPSAAEDVAEGPRRRNVWKEEENKRSHNLDDRMKGLELDGDKETSDDQTCVNAFCSPKPSPKAKLSPKRPSLPPSPKSPHSLTLNSSADIGMIPVIDLYHNMAALKTTVIQSYLDEHRSRTSVFNSTRTDPKAPSSKRSPDKAVLLPSNRASVKFDDVIGLTHSRDDCVKGPSHYVLRGEGPMNSSPNTSRGRGSSPKSKASNDSVKIKPANAKENLTLSDMWEYGMPLGIPQVNRSKSDLKNVSTNGINHSNISKHQALRDLIKLQTTSPTKSSLVNTALKSNPSLSPNATSDNPQRKATARAVSFLVSPPNNQETHTPSKSTQTSSPSSAPKTSFQRIPNPTKSYPNQPQRVHALIVTSPPEPKGSPTQPAGSHPQSKERVRVQFIDESGPSVQEDRNFNVRYADESQAYTAYTSRGSFTPHPDVNPDDGCHDSAPVKNGRLDRVIGEDRPESEGRAAGGNRVDLNLFLDNFLTLVDRYWNGTKSLHRHGKFQNLAHILLKTLMSEIVASAPKERDIPEATSNELSKLHQALRSTQEQVETLKDELDSALADKRNLQECLNAMQHEKLSGDRSGDQSSDRSADNQLANRGIQSGVLQRELAKLNQENEGLKLHVKHFHQLQELATMLQESHKSLVTTNDHLLQELDETKQRHLEEVKQLHWSYGELKRTIEMNK